MQILVKKKDVHLCLSRLVMSVLFAVFLHHYAACKPVSLDPPAGIAFFKGPWKDVLAEAQRQNKPIFLDVYTSWCPPCKRMAREAFPDPELGTKFNVHFINYQLDAEKGEGVLIAKQYAVSSYPTGLYIAPNGSLVHRSVGYGGIKAMIDLADHVLAFPQLKATVAKGDKDFAKGKREPAFLKKYLKARQELNRPVSDVLDAYLNAVPASERNSPETILFIAQQIESSTTTAFDYLIKTRYGLLTEDVASAVSGALNRALSNDLNRAFATNDETLLEKAIANEGRNVAFTHPDQLTSYQQGTANLYRLHLLKKTKNFGRYATIARPLVQNRFMNLSVDEWHKVDSVVTTPGTSAQSTVQFLESDTLATATDNARQNDPARRAANILRQIADTYWQQATSAADRELALTWAQRSVALYRSPAGLATCAHLLKKLGRTEEAISIQKEAIQEATKAGKDTKIYEAGLSNITQNRN